MATKHKKDQLAIEPPKKVQSILVQSPLPRKIRGTSRCKGKVSIMPYRSRPQDCTSGGYHCSQLCRAATKAPKPDNNIVSPPPATCQNFLVQAPVKRAHAATKKRAYRCTMHMGQGSSPPTCCKYKPNNNKAIQAAPIPTHARLGALSNHVVTKFKANPSQSLVKPALCRLSEAQALQDKIRSSALRNFLTPVFL
jgi:hypothetical protein